MTRLDRTEHGQRRATTYSKHLALSLSCCLPLFESERMMKVVPVLSILALRAALLLLVMACAVHSGSVATLRGGAGTSSFNDMMVLVDEGAYSFEQFVRDFDRSYDSPVEYTARQAIFHENRRTIVAHNQRQKQSQQDGSHKKQEKGGGYWMGVNPFADRRADELLTGYDKYQSSRKQQQQRGPEFAASPSERRTSWGVDHLLEQLPITMDAVHDLPPSVDWRTQGVTTPVKNQGMCGSCWAFASTAVLESHVAIQTGTLFELSPQELVSCAPNREHCGGTGGCAGSTAELAFDLVKSSGVVEEWSFGYQDGRGGAVNCTLIAQQTKQHRGDDDPKQYFRHAVASIADYAVLPSNNYTVLMNTVAKLGPVTVSVACSPWHLYQSGVFYAPLAPGGKATDLNHLVVLEGYGTDPETGEDYWLVRNSWSPKWGEQGYIRLLRVGDQDCGVDTTPSHGTACTLDPDGNEIVPAPQKICGNSGILFDTAIPLGGYLLN